MSETTETDARQVAPAVNPQPVQILPRMPLTLTLVGDTGAVCEGDACAI